MSMTLEEAIEYAERTYKESRSAWLYALKRGDTGYEKQCSKSMDYNRQLAEWLRELQNRRKADSLVAKDVKILVCGKIEYES